MPVGSPYHAPGFLSKRIGNNENKITIDTPLTPTHPMHVRIQLNSETVPLDHLKHMYTREFMYAHIRIFPPKLAVKENQMQSVICNEIIKKTDLFCILKIDMNILYRFLLAHLPILFQLPEMNANAFGLEMYKMNFSLDAI